MYCESRDEIIDTVLEIGTWSNKKFLFLKCFGFKSTTVSSIFLFIVFDAGFTPYQAYFYISYFIVSLLQMH